MTYKLRDYQQAAVDAVLAHIRKRTTSCLLDLATGAGKSLVAANIAMEIERLSGKKTVANHRARFAPARPKKQGYDIGLRRKP